jgi:hypothetical protein
MAQQKPEPSDQPGGITGTKEDIVMSLIRQFLAVFSLFY